MEPLNRAQQFTIAALLLLVMLATRFHHFGSVLHLPDASWAIFLAGGFYLKRMFPLGVFLAVAGAIDYFAITVGGVSSYCISPAYPFLIPAYAALWFGGRWLRQIYQFKWSMLMPLATITIVSVAVCFLISNSAFYAFSDKFSALSMASYSADVIKYFPGFLKTTALYVALLTIIHSLFSFFRSKAKKDDLHPSPKH